MMNITEEWLKEWESVKSLLVPYSNIANYFTESNIAGYKLDTIEVGSVDFPTGEFLVRDPFVFLTNRNERPYMRKVPTGKYPLTIAVAEIGENHYRFLGARILFKDKPIATYEEALTGNENFGKITPGETFYGFAVDAGLVSIADTETHKHYCNFYEKWNKENPDGEIYKYYFDALFTDSYKKHPKYQREGGDWINWTIPDTNLTLPMFTSGWGDGVYPVYFGLDENGEVCQLIIELINLEYMNDNKDDLE